MRITQYDISEFKTRYPAIAKECMNHFVCNDDGYLVGVLSDGTAVRYDIFLKTIKYFDDIQEAKESLERIDPQTEEEWRIIFSNKLYRRMQYRGYSLEDLACETDLGIGTISRYINAISTPSAFNIIKIAKALNCPLEDLMDL